MLDVFNDTLDSLINNLNNELDLAIIEDNLSNDKIKRVVTERITIKRISNIFNTMLESED